MADSHIPLHQQTDFDCDDGVSSMQQPTGLSKLRRCRKWAICCSIGAAFSLGGMLGVSVSGPLAKHGVVGTGATHQAVFMALNVMPSPEPASQSAARPRSLFQPQMPNAALARPRMRTFEASDKASSEFGTVHAGLSELRGSFKAMEMRNEMKAFEPLQFQNEKMEVRQDSFSFSSYHVVVGLLGILGVLASSRLVFSYMRNHVRQSVPTTELMAASHDEESLVDYAPKPPRASRASQPSSTADVGAIGFGNEVESEVATRVMPVVELRSRVTRAERGFRRQPLALAQLHGLVKDAEATDPQAQTSDTLFSGDCDIELTAFFDLLSLELWPSQISRISENVQLRVAPCVLPQVSAVHQCSPLLLRRTVAAALPMRARAGRISCCERPPSKLRALLRRLKSKKPRWLQRLTPSEQRRLRWKKRLKPLVPIFAALTVVATPRTRRSGAPSPMEISHGKFMALVTKKASSISSLRIGTSCWYFLLDGKPAFMRPARIHPETASLLVSKGVDFQAAVARNLAPLIQLVFYGAYIYVIFRLLRGPNSNVGKKASALLLSSKDLSFDDVAGIDTAKQEVQEVVSLLKEPGRYAAAGARLPSGVLMVGPPGTGKTLLARVMAAQAGVPFYYCSASDFVEVFVGRGAARVRNIFKQAAKSSPCIIFVDELDAIGKNRALHMSSGGSDELEQTLNQMLSCMDGLDSSNNGVVMMGATNRYDILDPALTRPGRFDRLVRIELPTEEGRLAILRVHTRKLKLGASVDLSGIAAVTAGYSGAELAAIANEAAIRSVRREDEELQQADFDGAINSFNLARNRPSASLVFDALSRKLRSQTTEP